MGYRAVTALVLTALALLTVLGCLLARFVSSTNHVLVIAATFSPYAVLPGLAAVAIAGFSRRWLLLAVALVLVGALAAPQLRALVTGPGPAGTGPTLTLATLNLRLGSADPAQVLALARQRRLQLLLVQELTPAEAVALRAAGLEAELPHHYLRPQDGGSGIGIYSAYPLQQPHSYPGFSLQVASAVVRLPTGQQFTVLSSHLSAPWPQPAGPWRAEAARLASVLAGLPGTLIDAGDFNATTSHRVLRRLISTGGVRDAATEAGTLTLRSYPADRGPLPPLVGIDHVLIRGLSARRLDTVRVAGSDHRAVVATLRLPH